MIGIYKIQNLKNGKVYIGQSNNIKYRIRQHKSHLRHNTHYNLFLQKSWNKYGEENFEFSIVEECELSQLNDRETYWCNYYKPNVYNLGHTKNERTMNETVKEKIRCKLKGIKKSPELIEKNRKGHLGLKLPPKTKEHIEKHRQQMKGRHVSPKTEFKKGHIMSKEIREKISKTTKGRTLSKKWCSNISKAKKGHIVSEETKAKISAKLKGRKLSEETKSKMKGRIPWNKHYERTEDDNTVDQESN